MFLFVVCGLRGQTTLLPTPSDGFSPNGDAINDFWYISGIEQYPNNHVYIYNRWGQLIFEIAKYDNLQRIFDGTSNKIVDSFNKENSFGTYYFLIRLEDQLSIDGYFIMLR